MRAPYKNDKDSDIPLFDTINNRKIIFIKLNNIREFI